jgi:hypothetical protein
MGPVGLEFFAKKIALIQIFLVHRSHSHAVPRHGYDERNPADVTANRRGRVKTELTAWRMK